MDLDWASDANTRKLVACLSLILTGRSIAYKSKSQVTISHITTEAEFTAAIERAKKTLYIRSIMSELGLEQERVTVLYKENTAAIEIENAH